MSVNRHILNLGSQISHRPSPLIIFMPCILNKKRYFVIVWFSVLVVRHHKLVPVLLTACSQSANWLPYSSVIHHFVWRFPTLPHNYKMVTFHRVKYSFTKTSRLSPVPHLIFLFYRSTCHHHTVYLICHPIKQSPKLVQLPKYPAYLIN